MKLNCVFFAVEIYSRTITKNENNTLAPSKFEKSEFERHGIVKKNVLQTKLHTHATPFIYLFNNNKQLKKKKVNQINS